MEDMEVSEKGTKIDTANQRIKALIKAKSRRYEN